MVEDYLTPQAHPQLNRKEIERLKLNIKNYINLKKKIINKFSNNKTLKNELNYSFKSMNGEMVVDLYKVISPSKLNFDNDLNPFKDKEVQIRNFLIVHLMLNYGLRVGELMLLTVNSIKKSIQSNSYNLIVTNIDDEFDDRKRKPRIKNEYSYRVIKLQERDYKFFKVYIIKIRKEISSEILFTSLKPPFSALSYSSIHKIFDKIDSVLRINNPQYFNERNYDSIERITPHVCRHTWAYMMLNYSFKKYENEDKLRHPATNVIQSALDKAQEDLRVIGGWSPTNIMPIHYGIASLKF